jgi:3,4-dihydroxy 2-butanone 4-phosphate synthase
MTADKMAFMVRYTSGLICTPVSSSITETLSLPQMVMQNTESHNTAYTISVDSAAPGITTGISASDRAATCLALADANAKASDFRRPGHVFPLRAVNGGVRARQGHTEAAVEFCRLAGLREVGVICELVSDGQEVPGMPERRGGGMMRRDECLEFGRRWGLKVVTIDALKDFVEREEKLKVKERV